jgi:hypothetical protein
VRKSIPSEFGLTMSQRIGPTSPLRYARYGAAAASAGAMQRFFMVGVEDKGNAAPYAGSFPDKPPAESIVASAFETINQKSGAN